MPPASMSGAREPIDSESKQGGMSGRTQPDRKKSRSLWMVIAALVVVIAVIGTLGFSSYLSPKSGSPTQAPSNPGPPKPGIYWSNTSFSGEAADLDNIAWSDFNVSCPTGNVILKGNWFSGYEGLGNVAVNTSQYGGPAIVQIISGGVVLATAGNQSADQ